MSDANTGALRWSLATDGPVRYAPTVASGRVFVGSDQRTRALPPTRPGCWINIIPAGGLVLIPEASASCICNYPMQTSTAYLPR